MEVVIVPAWRRPDFLHATLHRLAIAVLAYTGPVQVWVTLDRAHTPEVEVTARHCGALFPDFLLTRRLYHHHKGNSYNLLHAYAEAIAFRPAPSRIHLVEEDVFVAADYFTAAAAAAALAPQGFAVSACRNQNIPLGHDPPPDPQAVYLHPAYQSLAVSFTPAHLAAVIPHIGKAYLTDPVGYCKTAFPHTKIPAGNAEQDGLIGRIIEAAGAAVVYPAVPRGYHAGFHGYNRRGKRLHGPIPDRARQILAMTAADLNACAGSYPDHTTADLDAPRPAPARLTVWP